uniref:lysophospholipase D GDPD3a isoform X2 n=1 Tax=Doryrhamphus excisus TaxID=161450 RepID=UPI0025AE6CC4|nr:lysophospholipase D GDPD3a isoform X2 [Doryrhamphus excisus]
MSGFWYLMVPALGGYAVASLYLLKKPQVLHRRKRTAFHCTHISHRGGCGERIESTMEAFTHAVKQGTEMLELDCHMTHDGHVVVSHDENLLRQTGHDVTISSLRLQVSALVKRYHREEITVWASANSAILTKCRQTNGAMPYSFSIYRGVLLLLFFYSGLLPFVPLGESLLQFYLPRIFNRCAGLAVELHIRVLLVEYCIQLKCLSLFCEQDVYSREHVSEEQNGRLFNRKNNYEEKSLQTSCSSWNPGMILFLFIIIHSFIFYRLSSRGLWGVLEPIPAVYGREAGYTLDWWPANHRAHIDRQPFTLTFIPMDNLEWLINLACFWNVGGNRSTRGKHANSIQK